MILLDSRTRALIHYLLEQKMPISSNKIAMDLNLSIRQVRYALKQIDCWIEEQNLSIDRIPGVGIFLVGDESARNEIRSFLQKQSNCTSFYDANKRVKLILINLFFSDEPIIIRKLSYELKVSRSTIIRDLSEVKKWLKSNNIQLISKPNYGLEIQGNEVAIREAYVDLLMQLVGEDFLLVFTHSIQDIKQFESRFQKELPPSIIQYISDFYFNYFLYFLVFLQKNADKNFADNTFLRMAFLFACSTFRLEHGHHLCETEFPINDEYIYEIVFELLVEQYTSFRKAKMNTEIKFLVSRVEKLFNQWHLNDAIPLYDQMNISLHVILGEIMKIASQNLHPGLLINKELENHIRIIITEDFARVQESLDKEQYINDQINIQYSHIQSTIEKLNDSLLRKYHYRLSKNAKNKLSISLLAALQTVYTKRHKHRVLIVCNTGSLTSWLLESRIKTEFPQLEIIGKSSVLELNQRKDYSQIDLIISTINLGDLLAPFVVVNPLLEEEDIKIIRRSLVRVDEIPSNNVGAENIGENHRYLSDLLTPGSILLNAEAKDWMEVVEIASEPLLSTKKIEVRFINAMKNIIIEYGPYMVLWPGIALLHANSMDGVNELAISLARFRNPVIFGHEKNDPVDIAIVVAAIDRDSHYVAVEQLLTIINDDQKLNKIRTAQNENEICKMINQMPITGGK